MALVFRDSISALVGRINLRSKTGERLEKINPDARSDFDKVLRETSTEEKILKESEELSQSVKKALHISQGPVIKDNPLSNLNAQERDFIIDPHTQSASQSIQRGMADMAYRKYSPQSVKNAIHDVNLLSPVEMDKLEIPSLPRPPVIRGARRVRSSDDFTIVKSGANSNQTAKEEIRDLIIRTGRYHGLDPHLGVAVAQAESGMKPNAVSSDGHKSKGLFQLLDSTGRDMMALTGKKSERYNPFDPELNTMLGMRYLRRLHDIFSVETGLTKNLSTVPARSAEDLEKLAVAAFNAGEGRVARAQARAKSEGKDPSDFNAVEPHLPLATRRYVRRVTELRTQFAAEALEKKIYT